MTFDPVEESACLAGVSLREGRSLLILMEKLETRHVVVWNTVKHLHRRKRPLLGIERSVYNNTAVTNFLRQIQNVYS